MKINNFRKNYKSYTNAAKKNNQQNNEKNEKKNKGEDKHNENQPVEIILIIKNLNNIVQLLTKLLNKNSRDDNIPYEPCVPPLVED